MRISTSTIYDSNVAALNQQQARLLHTQQQVASGRRILTPADDPSAAARALEVSQSDAANIQYAANRNAARHATSLSEGVLQSVTRLLQDVHATAISAGSGALSNGDRKILATDLQGRLDELGALANSTDGIGNYLYSGFQGRTQPFANTSTGMQYQADDGQRMVQVGASRQMAASDSGADIFMRIKNGNGTFATQAATTNTGSGIASLGIVINPALLGNSYRVTFTSATTYNVTTQNVTNTAAAAAVSTTDNAYVSGQAISIGGIQFDIQGTPLNGDEFTIVPSTNVSLFKTISDLINVLNTPISVGNAASPAQFTSSLSRALNDLDRSLDVVLTVRASLGSRLREIDALQVTGEDLGVQFKQMLSQLQDVDYNQAISDLTRQQISLEAAQKSFLKVADLSLFNYI